MRKAIEESEISVDLCLDPRTPNLQDHWRAAGELGPVYLRNRGGSVGFALNVGEYFERRAAKRLFNLRQEIIERNWRHVAVQPGQLSCPNRRQQILPCREHLAKLYEGWSELLECEPRALLHLKMRDFAGFPPVQYMPGVLEQRRDASATHEVSEAMPHEDHADLTQARQLTGRAEQPGDHWLLFALLRLGMGAQSIRDAGQYATGKHCHIGSCAAHRRQPRTSTHAAGKLPHHACHTNAGLHAEVLGVSRNFRHFPAKIGTHRLSKSIRDSHIVFFQLS